MIDDHNQILPYLSTISHHLEYDSDLDPLIPLLQGKRFVLLGEASHGTAEFYMWRSAITKRIIENQDVTFIAVEGDWPDCYRINRYIKGYKNSGKNARAVLRQFSRWPTWMWANEELIDLIEWLKEYNKDLNPGKKIGFYGMDVYSLWESMHEVISYLKKVDPEAADQAKNLYQCFEPFAISPEKYALASTYVPQSCEDQAIQVLQNLQNTIHRYPDDPEEKFNILQNAFVTTQAEKYYRSMLKGNVTSWNNRDRSMVDTLYRLVDFYGAQQTAIVWAHNTHIGDARFTDMQQVGMWNVGQLLREENGEEYVFALGFSTYEGSVIAAEEWDSPMEVMLVPQAQQNTWDYMLHKIEKGNKLLIFQKMPGNPLTQSKGQRAIGIVYDPLYETGNYVPTILGARYDGLIHVDTSHALHPLHMPQKPQEEVPETYPSAL